MAFKDYLSAEMWRNAIKRYGIPKDPDSEMSALESSGVVYVGWDGKIFALDPENGNKRWSRTLRSYGLAATESRQIDMTLQAGYLYAIWNNRIFRLDPSNGQVLNIRRADVHLGILFA